MVFQSIRALQYLDEMSSVCMTIVCGCRVIYPVTKLVRMITAVVATNFSCATPPSDDTFRWLTECRIRPLKMPEI
jgi:hypothetical protein